MSNKSLWNHLRNACVALSFGVLIGVPVGNAIASNTDQNQRFQTEIACSAVVTAASAAVIYRPKRKEDSASNSDDIESGVITAGELESNVEYDKTIGYDREACLEARFAHFMALYSIPMVHNRAQRRMVGAKAYRSLSNANWQTMNKSLETKSLDSKTSTEVRTSDCDAQVASAAITQATEAAEIAQDAEINQVVKHSATKVKSKGFGGSKGNSSHKNAGENPKKKR